LGCEADFPDNLAADPKGFYGIQSGGLCLVSRVLDLPSISMLTFICSRLAMQKQVMIEAIHSTLAKIKYQVLVPIQGFQSLTLVRVQHPLSVLVFSAYY